jgi:hypothetical protein
MGNIFVRTNLDRVRIIHYLGDPPVSLIAAADIAKAAAAVLHHP